jgi:hypothetical protein
LRALLVFFLLLTSVVWPGAVIAAEPTETPEPAAPKTPEEKKEPKRVEVGLEMRWRAEFRDNADQQPADDFDAFLGQRLRIELRFRLHPHLSAFVQGQDVWLFGAESDTIIHNQATNLHQAYLDWKPGGSERWELRAGRQELLYGEERLVGNFGWDNVTRSFDAARLRYRAGNWTNDFFWGRLVDVRRAGALHRPGNQDLYGGYFTRAKKDSPGRTELYAFYLRDGLRTVGERPLDAPQATRIATLGFRRAYEPASGWRYGLEHAWQFGQRGPDRHRAAMLIAKGGYVWNANWQPRLQLEYDFATGDNDPADGNAREFNNLFPTNHAYYGYADLAGLRNLHALRLTAAVKPHAKLVLEADYHRFLLAARRGPWKSATGRVLGFDPTGEAGRDVGQEFDLTARLPVQKHVNLLAGYSIFLPGRFAVRTRGPETHHFGYIQTTVRF